jgi:CRP/FNR family transcriptional regulator
VVKSGRVVSFEYTERGNERIYNILEKNAILLEANMFTGKVIPVNFRTMLPSEIIYIGKETLLKAMASDPELNRDIIEALSLKFLASMDVIREIGAHNATWKICNLLLIFADEYGEPYDGKTLIGQAVSQQMISNLLGLNRITTVRIIKSLKNSGFIETINGHYCIRDEFQLKKYMDCVDSMGAF